MDAKDEIIKEQEDTIKRLQAELARCRRSFHTSVAVAQRDRSKKGIASANTDPTQPHYELLLAKHTENLECAENILKRLEVELIEDMRKDLVVECQ